MLYYIPKIIIILLSLILIQSDNVFNDKTIIESEIESIDPIIKEEIINDNQNQEELDANMEIEEKVEEVVENDTISTTDSQEQPYNENTYQEESESTNNVVESQPEIIEEETTPSIVEEESYIGVPSPNDFFYSIHLGRIDKKYKTLSDCYNDAPRIAFKDTTDINNIVCYEVIDDLGTVLGIYMDVKCNSENCERYKD